ncbi:hypothetical protein AK829_08555 [Corynebacterium riegelii]|uniref:Uncharacterized protein n=1 Tax=Corynebacterium riegelii TaxID=156976 RepID=A0A0K1RCP5_9CORY|nr:hypothetical protein AK829_08555 [Corynebacterium riegelii]
MARNDTSRPATVGTVGAEMMRNPSRRPISPFKRLLLFTALPRRSSYSNADSISGPTITKRSVFGTEVALSFLRSATSVLYASFFSMSSGRVPTLLEFFTPSFMSLPM